MKSVKIDIIEPSSRFRENNRTLWSVVMRDMFNMHSLDTVFLGREVGPMMLHLHKIDWNW